MRPGTWTHTNYENYWAHLVEGHYLQTMLDLIIFWQTLCGLSYTGTELSLKNKSVGKYLQFCMSQNDNHLLKAFQVFKMFLYIKRVTIPFKVNYSILCIS